MKVMQLSLLVLITTVVLAELAAGNEWEQVLRAGMIDRATGCPIRGTEIVHLVTHRGRLYAGNGYWMDTRGYANIPWAQVIALDSPEGDWRVDLTMGPGHLRVTALKSVTFATDAAGKPLNKPVNLLLAASDICSVYRRKDGSCPSWKKVYSDGTREHWELGGIRGLTAVRSPVGDGQSILFSHTDRIIRIDPLQHHKATVELNVRQLLQESWGTPVPGSIIAAYSYMLPLEDPISGRTVHVMGVQGRRQRGPKNKQHRPDSYGGWYAGGSYLIRESNQRYRLKEVNGRWESGKPKLVAPRAFAISPFPEDAGQYVYIGGFDCNFFPALDTAWIFRAPIATALHVDP